MVDETKLQHNRPDTGEHTVPMRLSVSSTQSVKCRSQEYSGERQAPHRVITSPAQASLVSRVDMYIHKSIDLEAVKLSLRDLSCACWKIPDPWLLASAFSRATFQMDE